MKGVFAGLVSLTPGAWLAACSDGPDGVVPVVHGR